MKKYVIDFKIPIAKYKKFQNLEEAIKVIGNFKLPVVVKSDGLWLPEKE